METSIFNGNGVNIAYQRRQERNKSNKMNFAAFKIEQREKSEGKLNVIYATNHLLTKILDRNTCKSNKSYTFSKYKKETFIRPGF